MRMNAIIFWHSQAWRQSLEKKRLGILYLNYPGNIRYRLIFILLQDHTGQMGRMWNMSNPLKFNQQSNRFCRLLGLIADEPSIICVKLMKISYQTVFFDQKTDLDNATN